MSAEKELGRYRLLDRLGQGGMATVYRAHDPQLGRDVAVKVMHAFLAERSPTDAARRFEREARAVAGLHHPNILALHDYQPAEGERPAYLVMELLSGPTLRAFLDKNGTPFAEIGAVIGLRIAQALEAAHARDLVHRDVKPENVMFDGSRVVLCDFGIARLAVEGNTMTATGAVIGSPGFMSPEQARGEITDARSDLFSLGSLLYNLATGVPPFSGAQPLIVMNKIAKGDHPPPMAKNPRVPRWLERIIEKCLRVDPAQRYASASEVVAALTDGLRADGLGDFDGELATYLRDPPAYNEKFAARVIAVSLAHMREAVTQKQRARALTAAARVLAWEPEHVEALGVVDKFDVPERKWLWPVAAAAAVAIAGGSWAILRKPPPLPPPQEKLVETMVKSVFTPPSPSPLAPVVVEKTKEPKHKKAIKIVAPSPVAVAAVPVVAPPPEEKPPEPPKPGTLTVAIQPWCDLTVDGQARGRSPKTLELPAGAHRVVCHHPTGKTFVRDVVLEPGGTEILRESPARVTTQLKNTQLALDDDAPSGAREASPGRHRITLYRDGKIAETGWVDVLPEGCRVVDTPKLACEKP